MMLMPILRQNRIVNIASSANFNLFTGASSPAFPVNLYAFVNGAMTSTAVGTPAFTIPANFHRGSYIYLRNNSTITGFNGSAATGGAGGGITFSSSSPGSAGGTGAAGGTALSVGANTGTKTILDNAGGSIIRGAGASGGGGGGGAGMSTFA